MKDLKITFESLADIGKGFMIDFTKVNLNNVSSGTDSNQTNNSSNNQNNNGNTTNDTTNTSTPSNTSTDTTSNTSQDDDTDNSDNSSNTDNNSGTDNSNSNTDTDTDTDTSTDTNPTQVTLNNTVVVKFKDDVTITVDGLTVRTDSSSRESLRNSLKPLIDRGILFTIYEYSDTFGVDKSVIFYNNNNASKEIKFNYNIPLTDENWLHEHSPETSYKLLGDTATVNLSQASNYVSKLQNGATNSITMNQSLDFSPVIIFNNNNVVDELTQDFMAHGTVYHNTTSTNQSVRLFFPLGIPSNFQVDSSSNPSIGIDSHNIWFDLSQKNNSSNDNGNVSNDSFEHIKSFTISDANLHNAYIRLGLVDTQDQQLPFKHTDEIFNNKNNMAIDRFSNNAYVFNVTNLVNKSLIEEYENSYNGGNYPKYMNWSKPVRVDEFIRGLSKVKANRNGKFYFATNASTSNAEYFHPIYEVDLPKVMTLKEFAGHINYVLREVYYLNMYYQVEYFNDSSSNDVGSTTSDDVHTDPPITMTGR